MQEKVYFSFFILCVILSQGILAKFLEKDDEESSKQLVRQKRVINRRPGKEVTLKGGDYPYIVNIKKSTSLQCVGTILSRQTAITAARCIPSEELHQYKVYSGSPNSYRGSEHNVTGVKIHTHNPPKTPLFLTGITLITVNPPFAFSTTISSIGLHSGLLLPGMEAIIIGWGYRVGPNGPVESNFKTILRLIGVSIMSHQQCKNIYNGHFPIADDDICTHHPEKLCGESDIGAPLVIDNQLVGVHIGGINTRRASCSIKPDVFVLLQHVNNRSWIMSNIVH